MSRLPIEVHQLFATQHGVASLHQLVTAGLDRRQLEHLERTGTITGVIRGAYRTPSAPDTELSRCAAWCLTHPHVAVASVTAGRLWEFRQLPSDRRIHLIAPRSSNPSTVSAGVVTYHTNALRPIDVSVRPDGIRLTSRARTALDLGRILIRDAHESVIEQAAHDGRLSTAELLAVGEEFGTRRPWVRRYLDIVNDRITGTAESHAELRVGEALRRHGVHRLVRQHELRCGAKMIRFDLAVPSLRWAVEVDVFPTHQEPNGVQSDVDRDTRATTLGWEVRRISREEYEHDFDRTIDRIVTSFRSRRMRRAQLGDEDHNQAG